MKERPELNRQTLMAMAEAFGLDPRDTHLDELHEYLEKIFPTLQELEELDLTGMEPMIPDLTKRGMGT